MYLFSYSSCWGRGWRHRHKVDSLWRWRYRLFQIIVTLKNIKDFTVHRVFTASFSPIVTSLQVWEYYTTNSAWPLETGGPVNSQLFQRYSSMFLLVLSIVTKRPRKARGQNMQNCPSAEHNQQHIWDRVFTRLRLSSQEWLICIAAWTSLSAQQQSEHGVISLSPTTQQISSFKHCV